MVLLKHEDRLFNLDRFIKAEVFSSGGNFSLILMFDREHEEVLSPPDGTKRWCLQSIRKIQTEIVRYGKSGNSYVITL